MFGDDWRVLNVHTKPPHFFLKQFSGCPRAALPDVHAFSLNPKVNVVIKSFQILERSGRYQALKGLKTKEQCFGLGICELIS